MLLGNNSTRFTKVNLKSRILFCLILLTLFLAIIFRTYNYTERISIVSDNSRDAQVATFAADNLKFLLTGNFASAGPFFYGPWWYLFLEVVSFFPLGQLKLWYLATALSLIFIALIFKVGQEIENKTLGFIAALYAAISPSQIQNSFTIWNPSITPLLVLISIFFAVRSVKTRALHNLFFLGFFTSLAFTIHFQNMLIFPILLVTVVFLWFKSHEKVKIFSYIMWLTLGFMFPLLPLIYFDLTHHWYNSRNFLIYLLVDQYKIWTPNRWLTYAFVYWPQTASYIIGGNAKFFYLFLVFLGIFSLFTLKKLKSNVTYLLIAVTFLLEVILFRYYRGERFLYLSLFSQPSVILLAAWITLRTLRINRIIGLVLLIIISGSTLNRALSDIRPGEITFSEVQSAKKAIFNVFPNSSFNLWECPYNGARVSHPIGYFIYMEERENTEGINILVCETKDKDVDWALIPKNSTRYFDNASTAAVYKSTMEWWKENPPEKGQGNFWKFIRENAFGDNTI